jgi:hypothetical protein
MQQLPGHHLRLRIGQAAVRRRGRRWGWEDDIVQVYDGWGSYPLCFSRPGGWSCSNIPATIY